MAGKQIIIISQVYFDAETFFDCTLQEIKLKFPVVFLVICSTVLGAKKLNSSVVTDIKVASRCFCAAYAKCLTTLWYNRISLFVHECRAPHMYALRTCFKQKRSLWRRTSDVFRKFPPVSR